MERQVYVDRGFGSSTQESSAARPVREPSRPLRPWQFVSDFQQVMGENSEPDPLFFVESWTVGVPAAMESLQRRRQVQAEAERQSRAFSNLDNLGTLSFVQEVETDAEVFSSARAARSAGCYAAESRPSPEELAAPVEEQAEQEWTSFAGKCASDREPIQPMTPQRACLILGVAENSSRKEIKAAYRRMVGQWHPDRLECRAEDVRQLATRQMASINEAYRLLCSSLPQ
jgi:DnaJ-domain-containing protein 1